MDIPILEVPFCANHRKKQDETKVNRQSAQSKEDLGSRHNFAARPTVVASCIPHLRLMRMTRRNWCGKSLSRWRSQSLTSCLMVDSQESHLHGLFHMQLRGTLPVSLFWELAFVFLCQCAAPRGLIFRMRQALRRKGTLSSPSDMDPSCIVLVDAQPKLNSVDVGLINGPSLQGQQINKVWDC